VPTLEAVASSLEVGGFNGGSYDPAVIDELLKFIGGRSDDQCAMVDECRGGDASIFTDEDRAEWTAIKNTMMPKTPEEHQTMLNALRDDPKHTPIALTLPDFSLVQKWPKIVQLNVDDDADDDDDAARKSAAQANRPVDIVTSQSRSAADAEREVNAQNTMLQLRLMSQWPGNYRKNDVVLIRFRYETDPLKLEGEKRRIALARLAGGELKATPANAKAKITYNDLQPKKGRFWPYYPENGLFEPWLPFKWYKQNSQRNTQHGAYACERADILTAPLKLLQHDKLDHNAAGTQIKNRKAEKSCRGSNQDCPRRP